MFEFITSENIALATVVITTTATLLFSMSYILNKRASEKVVARNGKPLFSNAKFKGSSYK